MIQFTFTRLKTVDQKSTRVHSLLIFIVYSGQLALVLTLFTPQPVRMTQQQATSLPRRPHFNTHLILCHCTLVIERRTASSSSLRSTVMAINNDLYLSTVAPFSKIEISTSFHRNFLLLRKLISLRKVLSVKMPFPGVNFHRFSRSHPAQ